MCISEGGIRSPVCRDLLFQPARRWQRLQIEGMRP